jgi:hypothetical protein
MKVVTFTDISQRLAAGRRPEGASCGLAGLVEIVAATVPVGGGCHGR